MFDRPDNQSKLSCFACLDAAPKPFPNKAFYQVPKPKAAIYLKRDV
jgi:hypothetical protein